MFAGIDVAAERHVLARLDEAGEPIGRPIAFPEDASGYRTLLEALGPPPALVVIEATGHYWKNLYATLVASGHDVLLLNPIVARRSRRRSSSAPKPMPLMRRHSPGLASRSAPCPRICTTLSPRPCASAGRGFRSAIPGGPRAAPGAGDEFS